MFYSMYHHRKSRGAKARDFSFASRSGSHLDHRSRYYSDVDGNTCHLRVLLHMSNDEKEDVTIKVTGYQWKWHYEYLNEGYQLF